MRATPLGMRLFRRPAVVAPPPTVITYDTAYNTNALYSGGDLIATDNGSGNLVVRANQSRNLGGATVYRCRFTLTTKNGGFQSVGLARGSMPNNLSLGPDTDIGYGTNGNIYYEGAVVGTGPTWGATDYVDMYLIGNLVGFAKNSSPVNSFNTTTGANGTDVSSTFGALAAAYAAATMSFSGDVFTLDASGW